MIEDKFKLEMAELIIKTVAECLHCEKCKEMARNYIMCIEDMTKKDASNK